MNETTFPSIARHLAVILSRTWWIQLIRGLMAIAFGILCFVQPALSLTTLVFLFAAYTLADGVLNVVMALSGRKEIENWGLMLLIGLAGIIVGVLTLFAPGITALVLLFYIAAWALVTGILEIIVAFRVRKEIKGEWFLILGGIVSVVFGFALMARPGQGALAVIWIIGGYAVLIGAMFTMLSFRLRSFGREWKKTSLA